MQSLENKKKLNRTVAKELHHGLHLNMRVIHYTLISTVMDQLTIGDTNLKLFLLEARKQMMILMLIFKTQKQQYGFWNNLLRDRN